MKLLVITRLRSSVFSSSTIVRMPGRSRYEVASAPSLLQVMKRCRACGRNSSTESTAARLSGLSPDRASETSRNGPEGGRQLWGCVRIRPAGTADTGSDSRRCSDGATHSAA